MEFFWTACTEILKILFSWPPIVLLILFIIIFKFENEVRNILKSKIEAKVGGASITVYQNQGQVLESAQNDSVQNSPPSSIKNIQVTPEMYDDLLNRYAYERIFNNIFGTQINLLTSLADLNGQPLSLPQLYIFYKDHQTRTNLTTYPIDNYLNFLIQFGLIKSIKNDNQSSYLITDFGIRFLSYIKENYKHNWNTRPF